MAPEKRGSIAFFTTYRPPLSLDIFSCPLQPASKQDELRMTDGESYNYNGQVIPSTALKTILKRPKLASEGKEADVDSGRLSVMVFVSERGNLEMLHIALRFNDNPPTVKVFSFADVFGTFNGVRMEDSGCIAGDYLVYVTTKDPAKERRQPWTAVYKTNLKTGKTDRLTPSVQTDLSPSVSPSGKKIAVASFQLKMGGWDGEIEDLKTDIFVMNVDSGGVGKRLERKLVVKNGGWPTWGSDNVIFFHRKVGKFWGVFRADISNGDTSRVTPDGIDARTPAAINGTTVAVATIRLPSKFGEVREEAQYRHIEIFDSIRPQQNIQITQKTRPKADHFNPFVIDGGKRIGYHRCKSELLKSGDDIERKFHKLDSPHPDVGLFRVSGVFPTFSKDGSKLAFVDNEFRAVWVADSQGLRVVHTTEGPEHVFAPVWNQDPKKDILYVCKGPSFNAGQEVNIFAIPGVADGESTCEQLTEASNNAFPSTNPDGHVNHPFFSLDGNSIVVASDLAAVSVDPISLPLIEHSVRPYGDIFTFDIDRDNINMNKNVMKFNRITQSRYENSIATWTMFSTQDPNAAWNLCLNEAIGSTPSCPYAHGDGGESWHMTGHLCLPKRCC